MRFLLSITMQQIPDSKSAAKHRRRYICPHFKHGGKKKRKGKETQTAKLISFSGYIEILVCLKVKAVFYLVHRSAFLLSNQAAINIHFWL